MTGQQTAAIVAAGVCLLLAITLIVAEIAVTRPRDRPTPLLWASLVCDTLTLLPAGYLAVSS